MPERIELVRAFRAQAFVLAGGSVEVELEGEGARVTRHLDVLEEEKTTATKTYNSNNLGFDGQGQKLTPTFN